MLYISHHHTLQITLFETILRVNSQMELLHCPSVSARSPKFTNSQKSCTILLKNKWNFCSILSKNSVNLGKNGRRSLVLVVNASSSDGGLETGADTAVVVEKPQAKPRRFGVFDVYPPPFGATPRDGGVNFAVASGNAMVLEQISLSTLTNRTGDAWHVFLKGDLQDMLYGYRFSGKFSPEERHYFDSSQILLDPYAKAILSRGEYGTLGLDDACWPPMACMVPSLTDEFDWEDDLPLKFPQRDLVIYEMHVLGFTMHKSSRTEFPGTFLGVTEKLDYLKELGINCIEIMPCHEFNELEYYSYNSISGDYKMNFWGYSTVNFFSPMTRYASAGVRNCGLGAIHEFKYLVKEAHKCGIEVIMDVVFNHIAEGNENGPILSFRGVDNCVFYMLAPKINL